MREAHAGSRLNLKIDMEGLDALIRILKQDGRIVIGPTMADGAIVYGEINSVDDLPQGCTDEQSPGRYVVKQRGDQALFGYVVGPSSIKNFLFPPSLRLWKAQRDGKTFQVEPSDTPPPRFAFLGVRACDIHAMLVQDRVFMNGGYQDPEYVRRRRESLVIAAHCTQASTNCFCTSTGTGPTATTGYDLAMTEVVTSKEHFFVLESAGIHGDAYLKKLGGTSPTDEDMQTAAKARQSAEDQISKQLDTTDIRGVLDRNFDHRRWDQVATRCLACANCTMVCPTCFCMNVEDVTDLSGQQAERWRRWDSCFTQGHSYLHGGSVRFSGKARYRQWLTHKLSYWIDQFGLSGCVGCGRCITWCPVGIDLTEEVKAIRANEVNQSPTQKQGSM